MVRIRNYFIVFAVAFAVTSLYSLVGVQDVKAQEGSSYSDLIKRIEALEAKKSGNVWTKAKSVKIGFNIRHRLEVRTDAFATFAPNAAAAASGFTALAPASVAGTGLTAGRRSLIFPGAATAAPATGVGGTGRNNETTDVTLQRVRLTFDADINRNVRAFINLQDQRVWGEEGSAFGPTGTLGNLGRTDLLEGYVEARNLGDLSSALNNITLRIGRWQMAYGNQRLLGHLNWTNQGRAYDGARLRWADKGNWVDLFAFQIEEFGATPGGSVGVTDTGATGAATGLDELLYGLYTHFKIYKGNVFEPYIIARVRSAENKNFSAISGAGPGLGTGEQRYTVGFRLDGRNIPGLGGLDYTIEPAWQFGKVEGQRAGAAGFDFNPGVAAGTTAATKVSNSIQAHAIYAGLGYRFKSLPWSPRVGYAFVFASGDERPDMGSAKTFDHLYPTGHAQLGYMDNAAWQNIEDHQIHFNFKPTKKLVIDVKAHFFSLDEEADSWYGVAGGTGYGGGKAIIRPGADNVLSSAGAPIGTVDDELGQEIDVTLKYKLFKNFGVVAGYGHFFAGDFVEDTGNGIDRGSDWAWVQTTVKF